jgi:hypothetical protein
MASQTQQLAHAPSPYTLGYGMRLDKGTAPEFAHAQGFEWIRVHSWRQIP